MKVISGSGYQNWSASGKERYCTMFFDVECLHPVTTYSKRNKNGGMKKRASKVWVEIRYGFLRVRRSAPYSDILLVRLFYPLNVIGEYYSAP